MIDIQWKGKIGYGDIISPICYAHNVSHKLKEQVSLTFRWDHNNQYKYSARDPETLWERADFIFSQCKKANVTVKHSFNDPLDVNHTSYDWSIVGKDPYHNYWQPDRPITFYAQPFIVVGSTTGNMSSLSEYGKSWKDPIAEKWDAVVNQLAKKYYVRVIDYSTPIGQACEILKAARGFVGYHGSVAWLARFTHTPSIIFTGGGKLSRQAFPYAKLIENPERLSTVLADAEPFFEAARKRTMDHWLGYDDYHPSIEFINDLIHV